MSSNNRPSTSQLVFSSSSSDKDDYNNNNSLNYDSSSSNQLQQPSDYDTDVDVNIDYIFKDINWKSASRIDLLIQYLLDEGYKKGIAKMIATSFTLVLVGPVIIRSSSVLKKL